MLTCSQVLDKPVVASPSNTSPLPSHHPPPIGRPELTLKEVPSVLSNLAGDTKSTSLSANVASMPANRNSVIALSPGITSAVNYIMMEWQQQNLPEQVPNASSAAGLSSSLVGSSVATEVVSAGTAGTIKERQIEPLKRHSAGAVPSNADKRELKESWRKSDSTNSHHTVRPNASRTSRPVSWAESFHSAYTIVPPGVTVCVPPGSTNKRLSALIADADFGMPEEEFEDDIDRDPDVNLAGILGLQKHISDTAASAIDAGSTPESPPPLPLKSSTNTLKRSKRRSISLTSVLPSTAVNFLVGGGPSKPIHAKPQLPTLSTGVSSSYADARKISYSISGPESFSSHSQSHAHIRQQSENVLIQQDKRPITPVRPAGLPFNNSQAPPMSFSPSHSSAHSQASLQQANSGWLSPSSTTNLKDKFNAFLPSLPRSEQKLPAIPPDTPMTQSPMSQVAPPFATSTSLHARQPTLSGLGPSAAGLAKRAVERMGKRWGDMMNGLSSSSHSVHSSGLSSGSGYSSTSTSTSMVTTVSSRASVPMSPWVNGAPPIVGIGPGSAISPQGPGGFGHGLSRASSRSSNPASGAQQGQGHVHQHSVMHTFLPGPSKSGGHKRTPNARSFGMTGTTGDMASSGASISTLASGSAASTTDSDPFSPSEPVLGRLLRGPLRKGKVVFGKELKMVVRETRIVVGDVGGSKSLSDLMEKESLVKALEKRMLPALVVRCAQHLLIWGVQEEGLFR